MTTLEMAQQQRANNIIRLQSQPGNIRNVCVLAHVDHGKTTLTDSLVASNGIISERLAGKLRFLDRREDEQLRGITMEAHAVSLVFCNEYLINLIDSPGHVDFSADVSSAVRLCDGAFLVVDVVEGVCVQTHAVARVAWEEGLKPCLVLNKVDRLCTELQLTIEEANDHLYRTMEAVNAVVSGFIRSETDNEDEIEALEKDLLFSPEKGNVVFSSGTDAWAFSAFDFAPLIAKLTGGNEKEILNGLWGMDKFWDPKTKTVVAEAPSSQMPPMFAHFVLRNIWQMYEVVFAEPAKPKKLANMLEALGIGHVFASAQGKDKKTTIRTVMSAWLPCARALLEMVVRCVPSPGNAQKKRAKRLLPESSVVAEDEAFKAVKECSPDGPLVCFVSKMIAVPMASLPVTARRPEEDDVNTTFVALGRVYSGTLKRGHRLYVVSPKGTLEELSEAITSQLQPLLTMGGDYIEMNEVPAGNVFALSGLGSSVLKTATLSDLPAPSHCPSLTKMPAQSAPLLRVSIEPQDPRDWEKLSKGLKLLNRADPVLEVRISPSGEHLVCAIGELHLERCLKDLRDVFAKVEFKVSEPLASFRETLVSVSDQPVKDSKQATTSFWGISPNPHPLIVKPFAISDPQHHQQVTSFVGPLGQVLVRGARKVAVRACPLPLALIEDIEEGKLRTEVVEALVHGGSTGADGLGNDHFRVYATNLFGNALLVETSAWQEIVNHASLRDGMVSGFQFACRAGPICEEPMRGVALVVELALESEASSSSVPTAGDQGGEAATELDGGAVVSAFADAYKRAFKVHCEPPSHCHAHLSSRLVEAIFKCSLHCLAEGEQLGNLYSVISRRRGKVVSEGMVDGTSLFLIDALIPVVEAYGIADELRKKTSGSVSSPQLVFSHWEILDIDPFFKKTTEDELEAEGETVQADRDNNLAYRLMTNVRRRKGLNTGEKVVAAADKQRTLSKKV